MGQQNTATDAVKIRDEVTQRILAHDYGKGPLLLLAGPGTGKSFSLKATIRQQVENGRPFQDFYAMTLTNAAAGKFEEEVQAEIAKDFEAVSTIHFLAKGILHKYADRVGLPKSFRILSEAEINEVLNDIQYDFKSTDTAVGKNALKKLLKVYRQAAANLQPNDSAFVKSFVFYRHFYRAVEWFDVMALSCQILAHDAELRVTEGNLVPFILVDEYQDLNRADQEFVRLLCGDRTTLLAVGDDDQSIYSGRFADATGVINFQKYYRAAVKISLPVCSRCPTQILTHAHQLITKNSCRDNSKAALVALPTVDERAKMGLIASISLKSGKEEAAFLATALRCLVDLGVPARELLVLCISKDMGRDLLTAIGKQDVELPLQDCFSESKNKLDANQALEYLLRFFSDSEDNLALRMLLTSLVGLEVADVGKLRELAVKHEISLWRAATSGVVSSVMRRSAFNKLQVFISCTAQTENPVLAGRLKSISETYPTLAPAVSAWEADQMNPPKSNEEETRTITEQPVTAIRFMTLHKSKGLDARYVFIPFLEKDVLASADVEEQRRLLYVGITRARTSLIFTWAWSRRDASRFKSGGGDVLGRSRHGFLAECGLGKDVNAEAVLHALKELAQHEQDWLATH